VAAGLSYWFEKYKVDDFAFSPDTLTAINMPGALILGSVWRPYTAHTVWARLSYSW
jgi:hypothetical protein